MPMTGTIRVLTVDDHPLLRAGIASVINAEPGMTIVAEAADRDEAIAVVNLDDARVVEQARASGRRMLTFGTSAEAEIQLSAIDSHDEHGAGAHPEDFDLAASVFFLYFPDF